MVSIYVINTDCNEAQTENQLVMCLQSLGRVTIYMRYPNAVDLNSEIGPKGASNNPSRLKKKKVQNCK